MAKLKIKTDKALYPVTVGKKEAFHDNKPKKPKLLENREDEEVDVEGEGVRIDNAVGPISLESPDNRVIAEIWKDGEAVMHVEILQGTERRLIVPEGYKVTVRNA